MRWLIANYLKRDVFKMATWNTILDHLSISSHKFKQRQVVISLSNIHLFPSSPSKTFFDDAKHFPRLCFIVSLLIPYTVICRIWNVGLSAKTGFANNFQWWQHFSNTKCEFVWYFIVCPAISEHISRSTFKTSTSRSKVWPWFVKGVYGNMQDCKGTK